MMRRALLNPKFITNYLLTTPRSSSTPIPNTLISPLFSYPSKFRFFSAEIENPSTDKGLKTDSTVKHDAEFEHPKTLNMMRDIMHLLNNPDFFFETVNHPKVREIGGQNPKINDKLKYPAILRRSIEAIRMEVQRNPERLREMAHNLDRVLKRIDENSQEANPATTGGDLGGAEMTTGSPAPYTDPLPNSGVAAGGTDNATNPTGVGRSPSPDGGVDDVSNSESTVTVNVRSLDGTNFVVHATLEEASDKAFKSVIEQNCDETLKNHGLESNHTVLLIRGSSWIQPTPSQVLGPRAHIIQAMHDSNPEFSKMMEDPEFKSMFPEPMTIRQSMTLNETVFSVFTKGPVSLEEMGFSDELLRILSAFQ